MQAINTNTRYLHPTRVLYAAKLLSTFPGKLKDGIVFFVTSGSEANDLALRLAKVYTKAEVRTMQMIEIDTCVLYIS